MHIKDRKDLQNARQREKWKKRDIKAKREEPIDGSLAITIDDLIRGIIGRRCRCNRGLSGPPLSAWVLRAFAFPIQLPINIYRYEQI